LARYARSKYCIRYTSTLLPILRTLLISIFAQSCAKSSNAHKTMRSQATQGCGIMRNFSCVGCAHPRAFCAYKSRDGYCIGIGGRRKYIQARSQARVLALHPSSLKITSLLSTNYKCLQRMLLISMNLMRPKKSLGQHFLHDANIIRKICNAITSNAPTGYTRCIEVGPGTGNLTRPLREVIQTSLHCIEYDDRMSPVDGVVWHRQDALEFEYTDHDYVVGNLPYNISAPLLVSWCRARVVGWCVMVQKEVAERVVATQGKSYGRLSVLLQSQFDVKYSFTVPPGVFTPPPKVQSAVICGCQIPPKADPRALEVLLAEVFAHRRKQLRNTLSPNTAVMFERAGIDLSLRPEQVSVDQLCQVIDQRNH
jgi:16S rRNA (adenine1518-N6/adenine1519-N6)-dimethyltransferase